MIKNRKAQEGMTVNKLIALILALAVIALVIFGTVTGAFNPLGEKIAGMYDSVMIFFYGEPQQVTTKEITIVINKISYKCAMDFDATNGKWCKVDFSKCLDTNKRALGLNTYCYSVRDKNLGFLYNNVCTPLKILTSKELFDLIGPYMATHFNEKPGYLLYRNVKGYWEPADPSEVEANSKDIINYISESLVFIEIQDQIQSQMGVECK